MQQPGTRFPAPGVPWPAVVLLPLLVLLLAALRAIDTGAAYEPRLLLPLLNILFLAGIPFLVAWHAARGYLAGAIPAVLLVSAGSLALGLSNAFASVAALAVLGAEDIVAVHNTGALIAGVCYFAAAALHARRLAGGPSLLGAGETLVASPSMRDRALAVGLGAVTLALGALMVVKSAGAWPGLFIERDGFSLLRQMVLGTAAASFTFAGVLFAVVREEDDTSFIGWFALGLLLFAVGLVGVLIEPALGTATSWAGRAAQYAGCVYLFVAVRSLAPSGGRPPFAQILRETHDRYRQLVHFNPDAILVHVCGRYVFVNPAAARLFGGSSPEALVGRDVIDLVHPDDRHAVRDRMAVVRAGSATPLRELSVLRLDGTPVEVEATASAAEYLGQPAILMVMRDITERKRAEAAVRQATREAERRAIEAAEGKRMLQAMMERLQAQAAELAEANRVKDEFLATLSHELRTPLNAILGWSRMLVRGMLDAAGTRKAVEAIDRNADAQAKLINDVLDVSRIVSGRLRLEVEHTDLAACVRSALASVRPAAEAKQITLVERLEPVRVLGDADRLQQVFWNLLSNAVKFTGQGGRISATIRRAGDDVEVVVEDDGIGIDPAFAPHLFERFRQEDGSSTRAHGGLGIGLAIARHLVELHGGRVTARSEGKGKGATFIVSIPSVAGEERDQSRTGEAFAADDQARGELAGVKILIVDDEADARDVVETMLRASGAEVRSAASAAEALGILRVWRPDLIVSDIGMPGEDGYDLLRQVRALREDDGGSTPALALTSYGRVEDRAAALAAGYAGHVPKPVTPAVLTEAVRRLVERGLEAGEGRGQ